jgi:hypothetical protein
MLFNFLVPFADDFQAFNLFRYLTFRTGGAVMTALIISFLLGPRIINWLKSKQGDATNIREDLPETHLKKAGTPTMGGFLILIAVSVSTVLWADVSNAYVWVVLLVTIGFGAVGFADDYLKLSRKNSKGLRGRTKLLFQVLISLVAAFWVMDLSPEPLSDGLVLRSLRRLRAGRVVECGQFDRRAGRAGDCAGDDRGGLFWYYFLSGRKFAVFELPATALRSRCGGTGGLCRCDGRGQSWVFVVQRAAGDGLHGRYRVACGWWRAWRDQHCHQT